MPRYPGWMETSSFHRAVLEDVTGISQIMDWVSDGDIVIIEMSIRCLGTWNYN